MIRAAALTFALLGLCPSAFAHAILMEVKVTSTEVVARVRYDRAPDDGGPVTVTLQRIEPKEDVAKLKLDDDGSCRFPRPPDGRYRVIAHDDYGHRAEVAFALPNGQDFKAYGSTSSDNTELITLAGLGIIAVLSLAGWWYLGRKKPLNSPGIPDQTAQAPLTPNPSPAEGEGSKQ